MCAECGSMTRSLSELCGIYSGRGVTQADGNQSG